MTAREPLPAQAMAAIDEWVDRRSTELGDVFGWRLRERGSGVEVVVLQEENSDVALPSLLQGVSVVSLRVPAPEPL